MHTLFVVIAVSTAAFGFAFLLAGVLSLGVLSQAELKEAHGAYDRARARGFWRGHVDSWKQLPQNMAATASLLAAHWAERPQSRRLVIGGAYCLGAAVVCGFFLSAFS
jgi:hypothetical protein